RRQTAQSAASEFPGERFFNSCIEVHPCRSPGFPLAPSVHTSSVPLPTFTSRTSRSSDRISSRAIYRRRSPISQPCSRAKGLLNPAAGSSEPERHGPPPAQSPPHENWRPVRWRKQPVKRRLNHTTVSSPGAHPDRPEPYLRQSNRRSADLRNPAARARSERPRQRNLLHRQRIAHLAGG